MRYSTASAWSQSHQKSAYTDNLGTQLEVEVARSEDGQWICRYEYPCEVESAQSGNDGVTVQVAQNFRYVVSPDERYISCVPSPGTVLLRITGDCACVTSARGDGIPFGRSLGDKNGFFLVALKEGEAICVMSHDQTRSMIYLFMDGIVNELEVKQWHNNFEPFLSL